jgi:carbamoyl-phosphate synthase large subunit
MPEHGAAASAAEAREAGRALGYPVALRLPGADAEVLHDEQALGRRMLELEEALRAPVSIDRFLQHAMECEADAVCDGERVFVPAVMEHVEQAGVHSGDSACVLPPCTCPTATAGRWRLPTARIACPRGCSG